MKNTLIADVVLETFLAHKLCIQNIYIKRQIDVQVHYVFFFYTYQIWFIILFYSFIFVVVSSHQGCIISIGDKMKIKGTSRSNLLILFALFALIIYQADACSSTKKHGKVNVSPELKATPIGSGRFLHFK